MNASERLVENLERLGVERIFGYPGDRVIELFDLLPESDTNLVHLHDEREVSVTAETYGRLTGEPGVLAGQGPWIGSLGLIGQMEARLASSPVVTITEASERGAYSTPVPHQQSRGDYGGSKLPKILGAVMKEHWFPRTPIETVRSLQLAFKHAAAGRLGLTVVTLDGDAVTEPLPDESVPTVWDDEMQTRTWTAVPTARDIAVAAEALDAIERPVIVSGNGVHAPDACDKLAVIAKAYEAAVVTSYLGKLTFPETYCLAGGVIGSLSYEGANRLVSEVDALLVVGRRMNPMDASWQAPDFIRPDEQMIVHVDVDPRNVGWVHPADVGLVGDAPESLHEPAVAGGIDNDWAEDRVRETRKPLYAPECGSDAAPVLLQWAVKEIECIADEDTVITADSGNNRFWLPNYLQVPVVQTYYGPGGADGMGWVTSVAVSAALATNKHVVGVTGDGGFTMTMTSVEAAAGHDVAPTSVALNDTSLGMVKQMQYAPDDIVGVGFHDTDFTRVVEVFDAAGVRAETSGELGDALTDAKAHGLPVVTDARIDRSQDMAVTLQSLLYTSVGGLHE